MLKPEAWGKLLQFLRHHHASPVVPAELAAAFDALAVGQRDSGEADADEPAQSGVRARPVVQAQRGTRRLR